MRKLLIIITALGGLLTSGAWAQSVKVNPDGVNVNASGSTVAFLTFGPLVNRVPAEGCWCGELISAAPALGFKCNPATIFGCLPARQDFSTRSGSGGFTDIMSIPSSVARRAYQAAQEGSNSSFFYVRRFISTVGEPDEFVAVTCRMSGGGARTPFALTDVKLSFEGNNPVMLIKPGEKLPRVKAEISYNGTGRLRGRWEVVLPGEELPAVRDLLTEASLPVEDRALQRRYTQVSRFNVFLAPGSRHTLEGPDTSRLPSRIEGPYLILLRIEATDDKEADSNLTVTGSGAGIVHSGAVAGFPLPPLRYFVGSGSAAGQGELTLLLPVEKAARSIDSPIEFSWTEAAGAAYHRLEIETAQGHAVVSALLVTGTSLYRAPMWLKEKARDGNLRWRVMALDQNGIALSETAWRSLRLTMTK